MASVCSGSVFSPAQQVVPREEYQWGPETSNVRHAGGSPATPSNPGNDTPVNSDDNAGPAVEQQRAYDACHVRNMPDYDELNGEVILGSGITFSPPMFNHGLASSSGWTLFADCGIKNTTTEDVDGGIKMTPVRAMVFNIPIECFSADATRFREWQTPARNSVRAASIAAILGLVATPLTKGWPSGCHEEIARAEEEEARGSGGSDGNTKDKKDKVARVTWHMFPSRNDPSQNLPMLVIGYEDLYNCLLYTSDAATTPYV